MKSVLSPFVAVHELLSKRSVFEWSSYWSESGESGGDFFKFFPHYIASLIEMIKSSKSERVFIISQDRAFFLASFLSALYASVPIVLPQSDALEALKELMQPGDILLTDQNDFSTISSPIILRDDIKFESQSPINFSVFDPSNAFVTFYTSGSTGSPKPVKKSLSQLENEVAVLEEMWGNKKKKSIFLSTVSHHHIYGLLFSLLWPVCGGYPLKRRKFSYWEDLLSCCKNEAYVVSSPSHLSRFPPFLNNQDNLSIKHVFSSGGPLSFNAAQESQKYLGILPVEVYGSTETGGVAYRQQHENGIPWTKFKGVKISEGGGQRLCVNSTYLAQNITFQTEDRVLLKNDQEFYLLGRADRIVKIEGKRICLVEIEKRLCALEHVNEAAVVFLENEQRNELGSVITLSSHGWKKLQSLGKIKFVRGLRKSLNFYFDTVTLPRRWHFTPKLPTNIQGKCTSSLLKKCFEGEKLSLEGINAQRKEVKMFKERAYK